MFDAFCFVRLAHALRREAMVEHGSLERGFFVTGDDFPASEK